MAADPYVYAFKVLAHIPKFTLENAYKYNYNFGVQVENICENLLNLEQAIALTKQETGLHNLLRAEIERIQQFINTGSDVTTYSMDNFTELLRQLLLLATGEIFSFTID